MAHVIDARGPTDWNRTPELKALRRRITPKLPRKAFPSRPIKTQLALYARALGISPEDAVVRYEAQLSVAQGYVVIFPKVNARGPTNWDKNAQSRALRRRIHNAIHRRMYA